jgi:hypothetical protein
MPRTGDGAARGELLGRINALGVELLGTPPDDVVLAPPHAVLKTSSGKIRRAATRDAYLAGRLGRRGRAPWRQLLRLAIAGGLQAPVTRGAIWPTAPMPGGRASSLLLPLAWPASCCCRGSAALALRRLADARLGQAVRHTPGRARGRGPRWRAPVVFVANHASYIDAFLLLAVLPRSGAFRRQAGTCRQPLIGRLLQRLGTLFVERFDARQGVADLRRIGDEASRADPLLFFPEGTFTPRGLAFVSPGRISARLENGLGVMPVALAGTRTVPA